MDGQSLLTSLTACDGAKPRTQYFEVGGKIGLYHDGWFLSGDDGRMSWENLPPGGPQPEIQWTLYDLSKDFSQSTDLSAKEPARLQAMVALWEQEAERNNVLPLDHRFAKARAVSAMRGPGRKQYDFWGKNISLPSMAGPIMIGRSFTVEADLKLDSAAASGVVVALGSQFGGWSLYLDQGRPAFTWARSTDPNEIQQVTTGRALPQGNVKLTMRFATQKPGGPATVTLSADGAELGQVQLPTSVLMPAGNGEMLDIGRDLGGPVTKYRTPGGAIEGDIPHVRVNFD
jgi:arylsulfatase